MWKLFERGLKKKGLRIRVVLVWWNNLTKNIDVYIQSQDENVANRD